MNSQMTVGTAERVYHAHMRMKHLAEVAELVAEDILLTIPSGDHGIEKFNGDAVTDALANQNVNGIVNHVIIGLVYAIVNVVVFGVMLEMIR